MRIFALVFWLALSSACFAQTLGQPGGGGSSSTSFANPTATAGPSAVNGSATTAMRSDAAPPVQLGSSSQAGLIQCGSGTTCSGGTMSVSGGGGGAPTTFQSGLLNAGGSMIGGPSFLMQGLGSTCKFTAGASGIARLTFFGVLGPSGSTGQDIFHEIRYANSAITSAPAIGAAVTGTQAGVEIFQQTLSAGQQNNPASNGAIITSLTSGAQYWFDIAINTGSTTSAYFTGGCNALIW